MAASNVAVPSSMSKWRSIASEGPQGFVSGLILLNILINDIKGSNTASASGWMTLSDTVDILEGRDAIQREP